MIALAESSDSHRHASTIRRARAVTATEVLQATASHHGIDRLQYAALRNAAAGRDIAADPFAKKYKAFDKSCKRQRKKSSSVSVTMRSGFRQKSLNGVVDFARNPSVADLDVSAGFLVRISGEIHYNVRRVRTIVRQEMENKRIGVIGLGLMGTAMSERLLEHGFDVLVWNRTKNKADPLLALGARWSDNPLADCDRVIISLYTSDVVESVLGQLLDDSVARRGTEELHRKVLIDTTTGTPEQSAAMCAHLASRGNPIPECTHLGFE